MAEIGKSKEKRICRFCKDVTENFVIVGESNSYVCNHCKDVIESLCKKK